MSRIVVVAVVVSLLPGCLRDRLRPNRDEFARGPEPVRPAPGPMAAPKPPQPPPIRTEPLAPPPPELPEVAKPAVHPTPAPAVQPPAAQVVATPQAAAELAPASGNSLAAARALVTAGRRRVEEIPSLECRLTKREVVQGKPQPQDEVVYRLRARPFSVYMKVLSAAGQGRELMYVEGRNDNQIAVVTGKADNVLVGSGFRTNLDPDSKQAASKSRYRITEAGFPRTLAGLEQAVQRVESSKGGKVTALGLVNRPESAYALEGVEVELPPGADKLLPRGGRRRVYFDPKPDSPGYRLPVLIETEDHTGQVVEFYHFQGVTIPAPVPDAAWNPERLGK